MMKNKPLIKDVIQLRKKNNDPVKEFATRNKASPLNNWSKFKPFSEEAFNLIFNKNIDGVKLKFKYITLLINGRLKNK